MRHACGLSDSFYLGENLGAGEDKSPLSPGTTDAGSSKASASHETYTIVLIACDNAWLVGKVIDRACWNHNRLIFTIVKGF